MARSPASHATLPLHELLYREGFGTRRVCWGLVQQGQVALGPQGSQQPVDDPETPVAAHLQWLQVQGQPWQAHQAAYVMLHKPVGTECSQRPSAWPSIYTLLPPMLRQRPVTGGTPGVQAVGRLDQDTTGLLLLSDEGRFIHRMNSPRHQVPKVYRVRAKHPVTPEQVQRLLAGVVLDDDPRPVAASACVLLDPHSLDLTLTQGKYHQVKRMVAAVGNRVEGLHRHRIGGLVLPDDLAPGQWRWLEAADLAALDQAA